MQFNSNGGIKFDYSWWIKVEVSLTKQQLEYAHDLFIC